MSSSSLTVSPGIGNEDCTGDRGTGDDVAKVCVPASSLSTGKAFAGVVSHRGLRVNIYKSCFVYKDGFLSYIKPHNPISSSSIARWILAMLSGMVICTQMGLYTSVVMKKVIPAAMLGA